MQWLLTKFTWFFPLLSIYNVRFNIPKIYIAVDNMNAYVLISYLHMLQTNTSAYKSSLNYSVLSRKVKQIKK